MVECAVCGNQIDGEKILRCGSCGVPVHQACAETHFKQNPECVLVSIVFCGLDSETIRKIEGTPDELPIIPLEKFLEIAENLGWKRAQPSLTHSLPSNTEQFCVIEKDGVKVLLQEKQKQTQAELENHRFYPFHLCPHDGRSIKAALEILSWQAMIEKEEINK